MSSVVKVSVHQTLVGPIVVGVPSNRVSSAAKKMVVVVTNDPFDPFDLKAAFVDGAPVVRVDRR